MIETTINVVKSKVVSIEPKAPNRSAKIPPNPVTWVVRFFASKFSFKSSRMNSTRMGRVGFSSIFSCAISELSAIFASAAFPSSDGIAWIGNPGTI